MWRLCISLLTSSFVEFFFPIRYLYSSKTAINEEKILTDLPASLRREVNYIDFVLLINVRVKPIEDTILTRNDLLGHEGVDISHGGDDYSHSYFPRFAFSPLG